MYKHTTFKIGGPADFYVIVKTKEELKSILNFTDKNLINITVLGNGSNVLVKDKGIRGITVKICNNDIFIKDNLVIVSAGVLNSILASFLKKSGLSGYEFASGIPGTVGGAIKMNAGAHGSQMADIVYDVTCLDKFGNEKILLNEELKFSYRHSVFQDNNDIITSVRFKFEKDKIENIEKKMKGFANYRKEKQPINIPNAGSTFKRGEDFITAKLIDECGLKGYKIGGAKISELHAGFIVNEDKATADDVIKLIEYVKMVVKEKFNKKIETEIEIIGE